MKFAILGSGSSGNSAILESGNTRILIDAGLSSKQLCLRLQTLGIDPSSLHAILLTHEHGDHVRGLKTFLKNHPVPIYSTPATRHVVREQGVQTTNWKSFEAGQTFSIRDSEIQSFVVQHDAVDPVGYVVSDHITRIGFVSDTGQITRSVTEHLRHLDALFIEANYDDELLANDTKRPWSIKQRISSRHGHLSNTQVRELIETIAHPALRRIVFGHLSTDCNHPEKILSLARNTLQTLGHHHIQLTCACQELTTPWFTLGPAPQLTQSQLFPPS